MPGIVSLLPLQTLPGNAQLQDGGTACLFLGVENERFEVRDRAWSFQVTPGLTVHAHPVPSRRGLYLLGPGWLEMGIQLLSGMRSHLHDLQPDPIAVERLLQGRSASREDEVDELPERVQDASLAEAVARMTAEAKAASKEQLIMSPEEWAAWVMVSSPIDPGPRSGTAPSSAYT